MTTNSKRNTLVAAAAAAVIGVAALTGCSSTPDTPQTLTINGDLTLDDANTFIGMKCLAGMGNYSDIKAGTAVVVSDTSGKTIALGNLEAGSEQSPVKGYNGNQTYPCFFKFTVTDVPAGEKFYDISIGHRGKVTFSEAEVPYASVSIGGN